MVPRELSGDGPVVHVSRPCEAWVGAREPYIFTGSFSVAVPGHWLATVLGSLRQGDSSERSSCSYFTSLRHTITKFGCDVFSGFPPSMAQLDPHSSVSVKLEFNPSTLIYCAMIGLMRRLWRAFFEPGVEVFPGFNDRSHLAVE